MDAIPAVHDPDATDAVQEPIELGSGWRVGPGDAVRDWTLGEPIGRGGSSVVFGAVRTSDGFEQHAAVKLLRSSVADDGFVARFQRERRILLELRHPGIVRLLDGGTTADGAPWYAMEAIEGAPLTAWAATQPLRARLETLIAVCRAVAWAHQRLVVHCDLKPDNVLVDAEGQPHVLDFGIAKLLDEQDRTGTLRMATPRWAAPEQVDGGTVTTATDGFALGLLLWATLTGREPRAGLTGPALLAACHEPLTAPSVDEPACRGDLDAIVERATATDPMQRYRSVTELADDLQRHLDGDAVQARQGLVWYRATRWARRHRGAVAAGAALLVLLTAWAATGSVQSARIAVERDRARQQAERAQVTVDLLVGMIEAADPARARGEELTVREVLASGVRELDLAEREPALEGEIRLAVGRAQAAVGAVREARTSLAIARDRLQEAHGADHPGVLDARLYLARADFELHPEARDATLQQVFDLLEPLARSGDPAAEGRGLALAAEMLVDQQRLPEAMERAHAARQRFLEAGEPRPAARALALEGYAAYRTGDEGGRALVEQALDQTVAALGTREHPEVADLVHELALITREPARFEESIALRRSLYGEGWLLASAMNNAALALEQQEPARAVALLQEAVRLAQESRGPTHDDTRMILVNLGAMLIDTGDPDAGVAVLEALLRQPGLSTETRRRAEGHVARARP